MRMILIAIVSSMMMSGAMAEEKQTPLDAFRGETQFRILMCKIKLKSSLLEAEAGNSVGIGQVGTCIKEGKADVKKKFAPALSSVAKKPAAGKLLKDYYASWLTAFNGIIPEASERKIDYDRRQSVAEAKSEEYWNRFEVEAGV